MAISVQTVADKIYGLLKGYGFTTDNFNKSGEVVSDPKDAVRFFVEDPNLLVTVDVENNEVRLSVTENTEQTDKLRKQLVTLARNYLMTLDFRVFGKTLKPSSEKANLASEEDMSGVMEGFGSMSGSLKTSYQPLDNVKIVVKHKKPVNEEIRGARSRNIHSIFIQRGEERFKLPENNLAMARAIARHVQQGGEVFDTVSTKLVEMATQLKKFREFVKYVQSNDIVNEENSTYVTLAFENIENIKNTFKKMSGAKSYHYTVESLDFESVEIDEDEDIEQLFTVTSLDSRVTEVVDSLKTLSAKKKAFENYIMSAIEKETFENAKSLIKESDILNFESPNARLGYQVGQLSASVTDTRLASYLSNIGTKLSKGGSLDDMEYRAVKASLLSAKAPRQQSTLESKKEIKESVKYQQFLDSFILFDN